MQIKKFLIIVNIRNDLEADTSKTKMIIVLFKNFVYVDIKCDNIYYLNK